MSAPSFLSSVNFEQLRRYSKSYWWRVENDELKYVLLRDEQLAAAGDASAICAIEVGSSVSPGPIRHFAIDAIAAARGLRK